MKRCPKCHKTYQLSENNCPKCHTALIEELDLTIELPELKKEYKDKKEIEEQLQEQNKIFNEEKTVQLVNLNDIELSIKEQGIIEKELDKSKIVKRPTKKLKKNIFLTSIEVLTVFFLLIISIYIIKSSLTYETTSTSIERLSNTVTKKETLLGNWITNTDNLYIFKDNYFKWYNNYQTLNNNFYDGTYTYKQGLDALQEMGYSEDDYNVTFRKENIKLNNIYSIKLNITNEYINSISKPKNNNWWIIMIIIDNKTATIYNKTLDTRYTLTKK